MTQPPDLPSYELVQRFMHEAGFDVPDPDEEIAFPSPRFMKLASRLIQHGAAQAEPTSAHSYIGWILFEADGRLRPEAREVLASCGIIQPDDVSPEPS